ncbi:hypothetical protein ACHAXT_011698 [Thalassiosira profunda]
MEDAHAALETDSLLRSPPALEKSSGIPSSSNLLNSPVGQALSRVHNNQHVLPNLGSTARDHLANERTYLAWIRTSLALIAASIALLKWDESSLQAEGYMIGLLGVVAFATSTWRYFHVQHLLLEGRFEPNVRSIALVMTLVAVVITWAFAMHFRHVRKEGANDGGGMEEEGNIYVLFNGTANEQTVLTTAGSQR